MSDNYEINEINDIFYERVKQTYSTIEKEVIEHEKLIILTQINLNEIKGSSKIYENQISCAKLRSLISRETKKFFILL